VDFAVEYPAVAASGAERDAFAALVAPHWPAMARLAQRLAPPGQWEDVLQDALTAAWRKRGQYDPARGAARSWLFAVVDDQCRKAYRRVRLTTELVDLPADDAGGRDLDLDRALTRLTARQRSAVVLHYYLGVPVAEVATILRCRPGTVKSTLSDARARLRAELEGDA
jgi:RNA polymerase sigma factor (sigma-70 family)